MLYSVWVRSISFYPQKSAVYRNQPASPGDGISSQRYFVGCILQILFSSYLISLSFNQKYGYMERGLLLYKAKLWVIKSLANQAEGWYSFYWQWKGRSCLILRCRNLTILLLGLAFPYLKLMYAHPWYGKS